VQRWMTAQDSGHGAKEMLDCSIVKDNWDESKPASECYE